MHGLIHPPALKSLPYGRQAIDRDDVQAVTEALLSGWLTTGPAVGRFEDAWAGYCGARHAVAVSNGTAALHLACLAAGLGPGDLLITSPNTFLASANCALYCGADAAFVDIEPDTYNLSPGCLERFLADYTGPLRPRCVVAVHFAGHPCDMERIAAIARRHDLILIEDACHAPGAEWLDSNGTRQRAGNGSHSDMTVFSFHPVKHITTGEGGAICTNNPELAGRLRTLRNHGMTRTSDDPWYYEQHSLGFNYRLTDFQCALGLSQLRHLDRWIERRREIAGLYNRAFQGSIVTPVERPGVRSSYHLYVIQVEQRRRVFTELREAGLGVQVHYIPVPLQPYYRNRYGYQPGDFPVAEAYYARAISLPLYPAMTDADVDYVVAHALCVPRSHFVNAH